MDLDHSASHREASGTYRFVLLCHNVCHIEPGIEAYRYSFVSSVGKLLLQIARRTVKYVRAGVLVLSMV